VVRTFTIITCDVNEQLRPLHARTPAILPPAAGHLAGVARGGTRRTADLLALPIRYRSADLAAWPVPRRLGRVAEDDLGRPSPIPQPRPRRRLCRSAATGQRRSGFRHQRRSLSRWRRSSSR
jgi:hypothetical protein